MENELYYKMKLSFFSADSEKSHISQMVFDEESQSVFWADIFKQSIMKMNILTSELEIFHSLPGKDPRGVAIDVCNRYVTRYILH